MLGNLGNQYFRRLGIQPIRSAIDKFSIANLRTQGCLFFQVLAQPAFNFFKPVYNSLLTIHHPARSILSTRSP